MRKKIAVVSIVVAVIGLVIDTLLARDINAGVYMHAMGVAIPKTFFEHSDLNYISVFFNGLLLVGGLLLLINGKDKRLIRYVFSLVLFSKFVFLLVMLSSIALASQPAGYKAFIWYILLAFVSYTAWAILAFYILRYFKREIPLEVVTKTYIDKDVDALVPASKGKRIVNRLADIIIMALVLWPYLKQFIFSDFIRGMTSGPRGDLDARIFLALFIALLQVVYYFLFELVFQATPGKMLTGTRVITEDGGKPTVKQLLGRSFSRIVPFEALSIIGELWHDKWSQTYVVNEKREGVKGGYYFLIFPLFAVLGIGTFAGLQSYYRAQYRKARKAEFEQHRDEMLSALDKLDNRYFITLKKGYDDEHSFLKVERVTADSVDFTYIRKEDKFRYNPSPYLIEQYYHDKKDSLPKFTIAKSKLKEAIVAEFPAEDAYVFSDDGGVLLLNDGNKFTFTDVAEWYGPMLKVDGLHSYEMADDKYSLNFSIFNNGYPSVIENIASNNNISIEWDGSFPLELSARRPYGGPAHLRGTVTDLDELDLTITVRDSTNAVRTYSLKSEDPERGGAVLKRIK